MTTNNDDDNATILRNRGALSFFPDELFLHILEDLPPHPLSRLLCITRDLNAIITSETSLRTTIQPILTTISDWRTGRVDLTSGFPSLGIIPSILRPAWIHGTPRRPHRYKMVMEVRRGSLSELPEIFTTTNRVWREGWRGLVVCLEGVAAWEVVVTVDVASTGTFAVVPVRRRGGGGGVRRVGLGEVHGVVWDAVRAVELDPVRVLGVGEHEVPVMTVTYEVIFYFPQGQIGGGDGGAGGGDGGADGGAAGGAAGGC